MFEKQSNLLIEKEPRLSKSIDFYKLTMGQIALEKFKDTQVTFTFKNRNEKQPISEYVTVEALKSRLDRYKNNGFAPEEIAYFAGLQASDGSARFDEEYLDYLSSIELPDVSVEYDNKGEINIESTGDWAAVSLWETVVMSEASEEYYEQKMKSEGVDIQDVYKIGDERLSQKIETLSGRPDIKFADFGTRRRFSANWQEHVISRLASELPDNFIGTSNPWFAYKFDTKAIGTYAHEMPMVYAALADKNGDNPLSSHKQMMKDWYDKYDEDLSIALTDTFTSEFFFADFDQEQAKKWHGLRHDSGDPYEFGNKAIDFYSKMNIDPKSKTIVFSDGLDINTIIKLANYFGGKINIVFGWGTTLMNDVGFEPNNIVMKATKADGVNAVKLSDNSGKHTGKVEQINKYISNKDFWINNIQKRNEITK